VGPFVAFIVFVTTYFILNRYFPAGAASVNAIPSLMLSIVAMTINQDFKVDKEVQKATEYYEKIYDAVKNYLHVIRIGSPEKAIEYINSRMPSLREVKNTSFNIVDELERADEKFYAVKEYENFVVNIVKYASNSAKPLLWKDLGDSLAKDRLRDIVQKTTAINKANSYKCKFILHNEPQINFIILEYSDGSREVLFNWDFRGLGQDPIVLLSSDDKIIEMFNIHFNNLWRRASVDQDASTINEVVLPTSAI
jgi:hypothetical protein